MKNSNIVSFFCDKLVRPSEVEHLKEKNVTGVVEPLNTSMLPLYLIKKIAEEAAEALCAYTGNNEKKTLKELADLHEAFFEFLHVSGIDFSKIQEMQEETQRVRGSYSQGVCLKSVSLSEDNPLYEHYLKNTTTYHLNN